jgi:basic membrane protein A and related proteins
MLKRLMAAAAAVSFAFAAATAMAEPLKVAFMNVGPKTDGGWTEGHWHGVQMMMEEFGDDVEVTFLESIPEGPDAERALEGLARAGNKLIFATSFGFMDPVIKTAPNVTTYNARFYQGRYITGQIAAKMSKVGVAGYIVSFPIPEVVMGINSFMLGAQSVNPDFKLKIVWVNTWMDPAKEGEAARALFDQGVDIITQHTDSTEPLKIAQERGMLGFGQAHDMFDAAPKAQLTAIVDNWGPYYIARVKAVMDGTWESQESWDGLAEGTVQMSDYTNMPDEVAEAARIMEAKITTGEFHPFTGPIYKQDGTLVAAEGEVMDDVALLTMDYYVRGVDGTPGQ